MATSKKERNENIKRAKAPSMAKRKADSALDVLPHRKKAKALGYEDDYHGVVRMFQDGTQNDKSDSYTKELLNKESSNIKSKKK